MFKPTGQLMTGSSVTFDVKPTQLGATAELNVVQLKVNWLTGKVSYVE